jgi:hypothetical protein
MAKKRNKRATKHTSSGGYTLIQSPVIEYKPSTKPTPTLAGLNAKIKANRKKYDAAFAANAVRLTGKSSL